VIPVARALERDERPCRRGAAGRSLPAIAALAMVGAVIAQFVAWIGALIDTAELADKTWFAVQPAPTPRPGRSGVPARVL
jgi:hypothetical protein